MLKNFRKGVIDLLLVLALAVGIDVFLFYLMTKQLPMNKKNKIYFSIKTVLYICIMTYFLIYTLVMIENLFILHIAGVLVLIVIEFLTIFNIIE